MTGPVSENVVWHDSGIPRTERWRAAGLAGATIWFTGLSGSGKSTVASALARRLTGRGVASYLLDGDNLRHGLNGDLGFDRPGREENVRRVAEVARLFADCGIDALGPGHQPLPGRSGARQGDPRGRRAPLRRGAHGDVPGRVRATGPEGSVRAGAAGRGEGA